MFGSTIKSEGDHDRFRSKADRVNVMTRMTREERMAKVDEKNGVSPKDSDDDLDSDWSDSSDDDSSDDYTDSDPDASRSGSEDDSSSASAKGSIKEETPAQKKKRLKKEARKRRLANRPTYRDRFDAWREKRAKERRHPTLVYYEKLMRKEQRKADRLAQEAEDKRIEDEALQREEWAKRKEDEEFLQYVRDEDERRYRRVKAQRQKEMENTMCRMTSISASRGAAAPSRHRCASSPGEEVVGGLFFDFEASAQVVREVGPRERRHQPAVAGGKR